MRSFEQTPLAADAQHAFQRTSQGQVLVVLSIQQYTNRNCPTADGAAVHPVCTYQLTNTGCYLRLWCIRDGRVGGEQTFL